MSKRNGMPAKKPEQVRCAIYTRVSTSEQADMEYSSLDAQRETAEAFVTSQQHAGWECLPDRFDDAGFTGANTDRPAFRRLLGRIEAGGIDCVVCYKLDRLTRSILDFAKLLDVLEQHGVSLVSITQAFDTATATGKLMMHILMSFAEFERQLISERTSDKMRAARRRGRYVGGAPILGFDIEDRKLVVDEFEADQVRQIFQLYLEHGSLLPTATELDRRGWTSKKWTTRKGNQRGGRPFNKNSLYNLLTNVTYVGKVRYRDEVHEGEHEPIVDADVFDRVQKQLRRNHRTGGRRVRSGALLSGLLRCGPCGCSMSHSYTTRGNRRYCYYVCSTAQKRGWDNCPSKSIPAAEIERFVVDQIRAVGRDPSLVAATLAETRKLAAATLAALKKERKSVERELRRASAEIGRVAAQVGPCGEETPASARLADLNDRVRRAETRRREIAEESERLERKAVTETEVESALAAFDSLWETLSTPERARLLALLIEQVEYDGAEGTISVTFHPTGIRSLADEYGLEEHAA